MIKPWVVLLAAGFISEAHAFPCYITLVKDSCWTNYNVSVDVMNVLTEKHVTTIHVDQGKSWSRVEFNCDAKDTVRFKASFSPAFWESDKGKQFSAKRYWSFPEEILPKQSAWNMTLCYPGDFSAVPLPPDVSGDCRCNKDDLPAVQPR